MNIKIKVHITFFVILWFLISIQGCITFTPLPWSPRPEGMPESYMFDSGMKHSGYAFPAGSRDKWWESFGSETLNKLIEEALGNNFSIREALARREQASAATASVRSGLLPFVGFDGSVSRKQTKESNTSFNTFSAGPAASYEVDFWGRIKADVKASDFKERASALDLETAAMSVAADVSTAWVDLVGTREKLALLREQVKINSMVLGLLELRFENAMSTILDVLQQREVVARAKARIPSLEIQSEHLESALSLLLGKGRGASFVSSEKLPDIPGLPDTGLPADLLASRPDVQAAGYRLMAANWTRTGAMADRLPSLNLTGGLMFQDSKIDAVLKNWIVSLGTAVSGVIFDGGRKDAAVDQAGGVVKEHLALYEKTVFTAMAEVENAMASEKYRKKWIVLLSGQLDAASLAFEEARKRYVKGLDPFIPFLTEQLNVQELEISLVEQRAALLKDRITLHRSLGGGFYGYYDMKNKEE